MKSRTIQTALIALALLLSAGPSAAATETKPQAEAPKASAKSVKPKPGKAAPEVKMVDINSASREELKTLPNIGDAEASKIIAGRPFLTKAHLQTHNIVSPAVYQSLRKLVIAKQKLTPDGKPAKK